MQNCKEIQALFSEYIDEALSAEQAQLVQAHIGQCGACRTELANLSRLTGVLKQLKKDEPPSDFLEKVNTRIKNRRSLDAVLKKILNNPSVKAPVTVSVLALLLFIVAERVIVPDYQARRHYAAQSEYGLDYNRGFTRALRSDRASAPNAELEEAKNKQTKKSIVEGNQQVQDSSGLNVLRKEQWPQEFNDERATVESEPQPVSSGTRERSWDGFANIQNSEQNSAVSITANTPEINKDYKVYTDFDKSEGVLSQKQQVALERQSQMSVDSAGGSIEKVVTNGYAVGVDKPKGFIESKNEQIVLTDTVTINVSDVAGAVKKVKEILNKYGIEQSLAGTGSTTQSIDFVVTVPAAKRDAFIEELKKLSPENVVVSVSPITTQEACSLSVQLKKIAGTQDASAGFSVTGEKKDPAASASETTR